MSRKKELRKEKEKSLIKKRIKAYWLQGLVIIGVAALIIQFIGLYMFATQEQGFNSIIIENKVVTTEVCSKWFNYTKEIQDGLDQYNYYDEYSNKFVIPKDIVIEVCGKWKKFKEEIDNENMEIIINDNLNNVTNVTIKVEYEEEIDNGN
jgi:ATP:corrinoid adenosyltransferase